MHGGTAIVGKQRLSLQETNYIQGRNGGVNEVSMAWEQAVSSR